MLRAFVSKMRSDPSIRDEARSLDPHRPAPNFLIVGAAKAGTTSLYAYLAKHPEVFMSPFKEPHYFSSIELTPEHDNFEPIIRDQDSYQKLFDGASGYKAIGEASPSYLCDAGAARRIKSAIPHVKIVISIRNPVQRAYSHYQMEFRQGRETRPFVEAIEADWLRGVKGWGTSFQYVELGLYTDQIRRYLETFGESNVLIILFEDLIRDTAAVMRSVACFLSVDPYGFPKSAFDRVHNPYEESRGWVARALLRSRPIRTWAKRCIPKKLRAAIRSKLLFTRGKKPTLDWETHKEIAKYFAADVEELEKLLSRDLVALRSSW